MGPGTSSKIAFLAFTVLLAQAAWADEMTSTSSVAPVVQQETSTSSTKTVTESAKDGVVTKESSTSSETVKDSSGGVVPNTSSVTSTTSSTTTTSTSTDGAPAKISPPSDPTALLYAENVTPGPFQEKRKLLLASIKAAKKQGFGITIYLSELSKIENQIKNGESGPQLEAHIDSIADGLTDQVRRQQALKSQRPTGVTSSHSSYTSVTSDSGGGRSRKSQDAIMNDLRQKYGDKLPAGLSGLDNTQLKETLMKNDMAKEYLKRFTGGQ